MAKDRLLQRFTLQPRIALATEPHTEPWHEFHYIVAGAGEFRFRGGSLHCNPGDVFYTPAGLTHHMQAAKSHGYVLQYVAWLPVEGDLDRDLRSHFAVGTVRHLGVDQAPRIRALAEQHGRGDAFSKRAATQRFKGMLYRLMSGEALADTVPGTVAAMLACIHDGLRRNMTLAEIAAAAGLEATSAVRAFRRRMQISPIAYHAGLRLDLAAELAREAGSVQELAQAVGYQDPFHFSRAFRARFGQAPSGMLGRGSGSGAVVD